MNYKIQRDGSCTLVKDDVEVSTLLWQHDTNKIDPSSDNRHLFPVRVEMRHILDGSSYSVCELSGLISE